MTDAAVKASAAAQRSALLARYRVEAGRYDELRTADGLPLPILFDRKMLPDLRGSVAALDSPAN